MSELLVNADNLYRTKNYIIKQELSIGSFNGNNNIVSVDTFYKRTRKRDKEYSKFFDSDGKRLHCSMTTRKYVD